MVSIPAMFPLLLIPSCLAGSPFQNGSELRQAVIAWERTERRDGKKTFPDRAGLISNYGPIAEWDVSKVTDMTHLFSLLGSFDEAIGSWTHLL
eukprot:Skav233656  [mRNA]  locus=scaffold2779:977841:978119:- [translate_table: standard]